MEIKIPQKLEAHLEEFVTDHKAEILKRVPKDHKDRARIETEVEALTVESVWLETIRNSLIEWKTQKANREIREQINSARDAALESLK